MLPSLFQQNGSIMTKYMKYKDKPFLNFSYRKTSKANYSKKLLNFINFTETLSLLYGGKMQKNIYRHLYAEKIFQEM